MSDVLSKVNSKIRPRATGIPEYPIWAKMIHRCENHNDKRYRRYGGRGIRLCKRWRESFKAFFEDMGSRPTPKHQIDRINNDGMYCCGKCNDCANNNWQLNCRWATAKEQARNTSRTRIIEHRGLRLSLVEWAERTGIRAVTISYRIRIGWSVKQALTTVAMTYAEAGRIGLGNRLRKPKLPPRMWLHKDTKCWCVLVNKKRIYLSRDRKVAKQKYKEILKSTPA